MGVEDAVVGPAGSVQIESWYGRDAEGQNSWTIAPSLVLLESVEIGGQLIRDTSVKQNRQALHIKWSMTPAQANGCQLASVLGVERVKGEADTHSVNAIMSCNDAERGGAMHLNAGSLRPSAGPSLTTWGIAFELPASGRFIGHVEAFGQRGSAPTYQVGLRTDLSKHWQMDGTVGWLRRETLYSLGLKWSY